MNIKLIAGGGIAAAVLAIVIVVVVMNQGGEPGEQTPSTALPSISSISSVVADAIVLPRQSAELSMPIAGIVGEILVEEGATIEAGQALVRLVNDDETEALTKSRADLEKAEARLERLSAEHAKAKENDDESRPIDVANLRLSVRDAREELSHVSGANEEPGAVLTPKGAAKEAARLMEIAEARDNLRITQDGLLQALGVEATEEVVSSPTSVKNVSLRERAIANARIAVFDAEKALEDAEDLEELLADAQDQVQKSNNDLANAQRDLQVAELSQIEDVRRVQETFDEAEDELISMFDAILGIRITDEEISQSPSSLFEAWGLDLKVVFNRNYSLFPEGVLKDNPETKWNELRIYAWTRLHPTSAAVDVTCEDRISDQFRNCIQQDFEDTWDLYDDARIELESLSNNTATAIADAENRITQAQQDRDDAQEALDDLSTDRPDFDAALAASNLGDARAILADLLEFPDPVEVALAEADMAAAQASLDDLLDWPDPLEVLLAQGELTKAEIELARMEQGRDPLIVARERAEIAEAEADVKSLGAALALAQIQLNDTELKAPFSGTVVSTEVDIGEEVAPETVVVRMADVSEWLIETDDLDELSVVNLAEGDVVTVTFDALPDFEVTGSVVNINEFGERKQGAITYTAEIRIDQQDPRLRWNMTAAIRKDQDDSSARLNINQ